VLSQGEGNLITQFELQSEMKTWIVNDLPGMLASGPDAAGEHEVE